MESIPEFLDWEHIGLNAVYIVAAFVLALPLGWHRQRAEDLGLRTIPLVSVASCGYLLIGQGLIGASADSIARLLQGLMTGVGFLGGGAILKEGVNIRGTSTAASIWNTAAIGAAVACNRFEIAVLLAAINFAILTTLRGVRDEMDGGRELEDEED